MVCVCSVFIMQCNCSIIGLQLLGVKFTLDTNIIFFVHWTDFTRAAEKCWRVGSVRAHYFSYRKNFFSDFFNPPAFISPNKSSKQWELAERYIWDGRGGGERTLYFFPLTDAANASLLPSQARSHFRTTCALQFPFIESSIHCWFFFSKGNHHENDANKLMERIFYRFVMLANLSSNENLFDLLQRGEFWVDC